jgi:hypothetical protein
MGSLHCSLHVDTRTFCVQFMNGVTTIKLSKPSLELFMNFVQRREMWSLLAVCNECIRFDKQTNVMSSKDIRPLEGLRVKGTADEGVMTNSQPVDIGLLEGCLEDKLVELFLSGSLQVHRAPQCRLIVLNHQLRVPESDALRYRCNRVCTVKVRKCASIWH